MAISYGRHPFGKEDSLSDKLAYTGAGALVGALITLTGASIAGTWAIVEKYGIIGRAVDVDAFTDFTVGKGPAILGVCAGAGIIADLYRAWDRYQSRHGRKNF